MRESYSRRVTAYLEASRTVLSSALEDRTFLDSVSHSAEIIIAALRAGKKILLAGNGGSAADAQNLATELMVRFYLDRASLPALALGTDSSVATAIGYDLGFVQLFSRQGPAVWQPGGVVVGRLTSGPS